jgi:hypothetical protein
MIVSSCQNRPKEVLNRKNMEQLMYDIYIAEATLENDYGNFNTPEKKEAYINQIFRAHDVTQAEWDTSLSWYSDRIDLYLKMNDSVKVRLQRTRKEIDKQLQRLNAQQVVNPALLSPSYIPPVYTFSMPGIKKGFFFLLDSAEISSSISTDQFSFTFSVIGVPPFFNASLLASLTLVYADTVISQSQSIDENKTYTMAASRFIPGDTLTQINGFVHLDDSSAVVPGIQLYNIYLGDGKRDSLDLHTGEVQPHLLQPRDQIRVDTVTMVK